MAIQGIGGPDEAQFQAFQALNAGKQENVQKDAEDQSLIAKLNAPQDKDESAKQIFKLSVEKEQGKGINLNIIG